MTKRASYQILRYFGDEGKFVVLNDGLGNVLELSTLTEAMKLLTLLNENAGDTIRYKLRKV